MERSAHERPSRGSVGCGVTLLAIAVLARRSGRPRIAVAWFYSWRRLARGGINWRAASVPGTPVPGPAMQGGGPNIQGGVPGGAAQGGGQRFSNPFFGGFTLFPMSPRFPLIAMPNFQAPVVRAMPMGGFGPMAFPMGGFFIPPTVINMRNPPAGFGMKGGFGGFAGGGYGL